MIKKKSHLPLRKKIYHITSGSAHNKLSLVYNIFIIIAIFLSILPLLWRVTPTPLAIIEFFTIIIFMVDYFLQFITADYRLKKGKLSFLLYPFTPWAIINMVAIIASLQILPSSLVIVRLLNVFRILRVFKIIRKSKEFHMIANVFRKNGLILLSLAGISFFYIFITATIIFNAEPETYPSFFEALYWSATTLTTIGIGDVAPVSTIGKTITIVSSFFGIAIVTMPTGVITAGFMQELDNEKKKKVRIQKRSKK